MENILYIQNDIAISKFNDTEDKFFVAGYACHYHTPNLNNEIVDANSFSKFFEMRNAGQISTKLNYQHNMENLIGAVDEITSLSDGLYITAHLNKGVKLCDETLIPNIVCGDLNSFSTEGFVLDGYDGIVENKDGTYYVKDFILTGVALVTTPADYNAKFSIKNYMQNKPTKPVKHIYWFL